MIPETSPTAIYEACHPWQTDLIRQVWAAAYSKGVADTDRAHAILDEPEFKITELLRVPLPEKERLKLLYEEKLQELRGIAAEINRVPVKTVKSSKVVQLYQPRVITRKRALNGQYV